MAFADLYKTKGKDLSRVAEYLSICRDMRLLSPDLFWRHLTGYLQYHKMNIFDFIFRKQYVMLIHHDLEKDKQIQMIQKIFASFYYYLRHTEHKAKKLEVQEIKDRTWKA